MITGFLLQILYVFIQFIVDLLPEWEFPTGIIQAWALIWGFMNGLNFLFPVATLLQVLTLSIAFEILVVKWHLGHRVISYLRGR